MTSLLFDFTFPLLATFCCLRMDYTFLAIRISDFGGKLLEDLASFVIVPYSALSPPPHGHSFYFAINIERMV